MFSATLTIPSPHREVLKVLANRMNEIETFAAAIVRLMSQNRDARSDHEQTK